MLQQNSKNYDYLFKIIFSGASGVGKTSVQFRYIDGIYKENNISTIGVDFRMKTIQIDELIVKLQIWDTPGPERFRPLYKQFYRGVHGLYIMFSVDDRESFIELQKFIQLALQFKDENLIIFIVGNKIDLQNRVISTQEGQECADKYGFQYIEISVKDGVNVELMFDTMVREIVKQKQDNLENEMKKLYPQPSKKPPSSCF